MTQSGIMGGIMGVGQVARGWQSRLFSRAAIATVAVAAVLAGCAVGGGGQISSGLSAPAGAAPTVTQADARLKAKVAMLLPLTGSAQSAAVAKGMKQAAELALFELNNPGFQLIVKDTMGTPEGAAAAATMAASEGVELIIGPLFATSVTSVAPIARQAGLPVIAFSNDRNVTGNGVYLLSFMAEEEVSRIVSYAASRGKRTFAALVPDNSYGALMGSAFRNAVSRNGGIVIALETYPNNANGMLEPSQRLFKLVKDSAQTGSPVDAIFLPGGPDTLPNLAPLIQYANTGSAPVKFLGSGGWDYPNLGRNSNFIGSWYPAPDPRGWRSFSEKFTRTFGSAPPRIATLAYDAVTVAIQLASTHPAGSRYTAQNLTVSNGFVGVDGSFRFTPGGISEHSLAVLEVQQFEATMVDAAASGFAPSRMVSTGALRN